MPLNDPCQVWDSSPDLAASFVILLLFLEALQKNKQLERAHFLDRLLARAREVYCKGKDESRKILDMLSETR
jgi:hypothetical protein